MKYIINSIIFILMVSNGFAQSVNTDSIALAQAQWNWQKEGKVRFSTVQVRLFDSEQTISVAKYPAKKLRTEIVSAEREKADRTSVLARNFKAKAAINGSYFNMKELTAVTYVKDNNMPGGNVSQREGFRSNGMLLLGGKKKRIDIVTCIPSDYEAVAAEWPEAIVSGPVLIEEGTMLQHIDIPQNQWDSFYAKRHPRSVIGYDSKGWIYMIVIDGRNNGIADGTSIDETARIAQYLGLVEAINLDGGGSSTLWLKKGGVINHPTDNRTFDNKGERKVPNIIIAR